MFLARHYYWILRIILSGCPYPEMFYNPSSQVLGNAIHPPKCWIISSMFSQKLGVFLKCPKRWESIFFFSLRLGVLQFSFSELMVSLLYSTCCDWSIWLIENWLCVCISLCHLDGWGSYNCPLEGLSFLLLTFIRPGDPLYFSEYRESTSPSFQGWSSTSLFFPGLGYLLLNSVRLQTFHFSALMVRVFSL